MTLEHTDIQTILRRILSRDWIVFLVVSMLLICLVVETSIVKVSGFEGVSNIYVDIQVFGVLEVYCIISQLILLNYVQEKISNFVSINKPYLRIIHRSVLSAQLGIILLLIVMLFEVTIIHKYHLILLQAIFITSFLTATCMMAVLSSRFIIWMRTNPNRLTLTYLLASSCLSLSAGIGITYVMVQLSDPSIPDIVTPKAFGEFVMHSNIGDPSLTNAYNISFVIAFILLWIGSIFLLQSYRKRIGNIKYWIIMSIPLVYFLSQFEPLFLNILFNGSLEDLAMFSILYILIVVVSRPVGSILFGLSFLQVAQKLQQPEVKGYMTVSAIGLLLLLESYQAQVLITAPFPPFGLLSVSFIGICSYLIFIGIYSSAISVSQDSRLRASIRRSIESEVKFIGNIGSAEMDHTITDKVLKIERRVSENMRESTGISSSITDKELADYIDEVLQETKRKVNK